MKPFRFSRWRFRLALYLLCCVFFVSQVPAAYRIVLKDGTVLEGKSKPISMGGSYLFTAPDGRSLVIPLEQVDADTTKAANSFAETTTKPKVFTNDDLPSRPPAPANALTPAPASAQKLSDQKQEVPKDKENAPLTGEAYWREETRKLQRQIAEVDGIISTLKDAIPYCSPLLDTACVLLGPDRGQEMREAEAKKRALEAEFELLLERGRKAGAPPGWFR